MDHATAVDIVGGELSQPSKMPCASWGIPASMCVTGGALRGVAGSTCSSCYAMKGRYPFASVQAALQRKLDAFIGNLWLWPEAMAYLIIEDGRPEFRWFHSGDLQDLTMLIKIVEVCELTPEVRHWLSTREVQLVRYYLRHFGAFPANLVVRVSAAMVDGDPPSFAHTSRVHRHLAPVGFECRSPANDGRCMDCRACWSADVPLVSYHYH